MIRKHWFSDSDGTCGSGWQADYSRYEGRHLAASLSLPLMEAPGEGLVGRVAAYLNPKCAALLLDASLCSPATVRLNIYQVLLLNSALPRRPHLRLACPHAFIRFLVQQCKVSMWPFLLPALLVQALTGDLAACLSSAPSEREL